MRSVTGTNDTNISAPLACRVAPFSRRAGSGRSRSPSSHTARSARTTPRSTSRRLAFLRSPADAGAWRMRRSRTAWADSQRLNVASRPTGASPIPTTSIKPAAVWSSASTSLPAAAKSRHERRRTSARVITATRPVRSPSTMPSRGLTPRHVPCPPSLRRRTVKCSSARCQRRGIRCEAKKLSRCSSVSQTAKRAVRRRSAPGPVSSPLPVPRSFQNFRPWYTS